MFEKFIETYGQIQNKEEISSETLDEVKKTLPPELFELISDGQGSYIDDFLWIVDSLEYKDLLQEVYIPLKLPSVCFARDAFGSLYVWEDNTVYNIDLRLHTWKVIGRKPLVLFNGIMTDWSYFSKQVNAELYKQAKESLGALSSDECYGYFPLIRMGGAESVENLKKVKIKEYISIVAQALGPIQ